MASKETTHRARGTHGRKLRKLAVGILASAAVVVPAVSAMSTAVSNQAASVHFHHVGGRESFRLG